MRVRFPLVRPGAFSLLAFSLLLLPIQTGAGGADQIFLSGEAAPREIFPQADGYERQVISATPALREQIQGALGRTRPSLWEPSYPTYLARKEGKVIGYGVIVEEIGKHRPITFIVGVGPEGKVVDVAVMAYREAQGGEVRMKRFLRQYREKGLHNPLLPQQDIVNITGATLSAYAISRGVKKALALVEAVYLHPTNGSALEPIRKPPQRPSSNGKAKENGEFPDGPFKPPDPKPKAQD